MPERRRHSSPPPPWHPICRCRRLMVLCLYIGIYLAPLGGRPLIIPDESRYAEIPREMLLSNDWVVPRLNGVVYFEKPVLGYWLNAAAIAILGRHRFAVRLPAALAAGATAFLLFVLVRRHDNDDTRGLTSAGILLVSPLFFAVGTTAVLDMPLTMFLTGAMVSFFFAGHAPGGRRRWEIAFGVCCGLAFLTKGFLGFAVPVVAIVPFMLWERRWRELPAMAPVPLAAAALTCLPWSIAIQIRDDDFWRFFFWNEHVRRFLSSQPQHPNPWWYFLPILLAGMLPWTFTISAAVSGSKGGGAGHDKLWRYACCWFLFPFLLFSASHGKLGTYILPCLPPFALLTATGLRAYLGQGGGKAFNVGAGVGAALFSAGAAVLLVHGATGATFFPLPVYNSGPAYRWLIAVFALGSWAVAMGLAAAASLPERKLAFMTAGPAILLAVTGIIFPDEARSGKVPGAFLSRHAAAVTTETVVAADQRLVRAVCWFWQRRDVWLVDGAGELAYGIERDKPRARLLTPAELAEFLQHAAPTVKLVVVTTTGHYRKWKKWLPRPRRLDFGDGFAFAEFGPVADIDRRANGP